ncbi:MAG: 3-hydroxyacyl-CoA dehydrogenase family protein [Ilumatobacter sp.]|nr:3-hydroxyacyl-CoA dehydrogenase family protein [Ilumatobacter sp.]
MTGSAATVLVVGGGTMGAGIAQNMAEIGVHAFVSETDPVTADAAQDRVADGLRRRFRAEADMDERVAEHLARCTITVGLPDIAPDLIVEAVPEITELKRSLLADLDRRYPDVPILASNTSSLSIDDLAAHLDRPSRFIGMHFFNPVPKSDLVELVVGADTADVTVAATVAWVERLDKTAIVVRDSPGFATSRLGVALGLEAIRMVEEGVASADDIDRGMVLGYKLPIGPLRLTDLVGLDVRLKIAEHLHATLGPRFEPPELLRTMVADGRLGKKTGEGFHTWP